MFLCLPGWRDCVRHGQIEDTITGNHYREPSSTVLLMIPIYCFNPFLRARSANSLRFSDLQFPLWPSVAKRRGSPLQYTERFRSLLVSSSTVLVIVHFRITEASSGIYSVHLQCSNVAGFNISNLH